MDAWKVFSWGHRVYRKARRLVTATYRLMSKWRIVQLAALGTMIVLWFVVQAGPPTSRSSGRPNVPQLTSPYTLGLDDPYEVIGMMNQRQVELSEGTTSGRTSTLASSQSCRRLTQEVSATLSTWIS